MDLNSLICVILALCVITVDTLMFHLSPNQKKCLKEEIHKDVLVTGEYELSDAPGQKTNLAVTDTKGHTLYTKEDAKRGKFAFTTEEYDMFEVCFESKMVGGGQGGEREVSLNMKHGVEAKSYEDNQHILE